MITYINETLNILINRDLTGQDTSAMNTFLFFHAFYLRIFNNPKNFF